MKFIKYSSLLILLITITLNAQNMSLFSKATQSGWYPDFLSSVVNTIVADPKNKIILDIGTGPGTLPQMLIAENPAFQITGIDIDPSMIAEANKRNSQQNISFLIQQQNEKLPFSTSQFDVITFCSVLFLLDDTTKKSLIEEALRVLKPEGKILILTPSGKKSIFSSFFEVWRYKFSFNNFTFPIWKIATTNSARKWQSQKWLKKYAERKALTYSRLLTFNDNATLEIMSNNKIKM